MNLAVARRFSISCSSSSDPRVPRYAPLVTTWPVGATRQENITAASFCPFLIRSAVSIVLISEFGAVPTNAGRISGNFGRGDGDGDGDPGFGVWAETTPALSNKPRKQKIRVAWRNRQAKAV